MGRGVYKNLVNQIISNQSARRRNPDENVRRLEKSDPLRALLEKYRRNQVSELSIKLAAQLQNPTAVQLCQELFPEFQIPQFHFVPDLERANRLAAQLTAAQLPEGAPTVDELVTGQKEADYRSFLRENLIDVVKQMLYESDKEVNKQLFTIVWNALISKIERQPNNNFDNGIRDFPQIKAAINSVYKWLKQLGKVSPNQDTKVKFDFLRTLGGFLQDQGPYAAMQYEYTFLEFSDLGTALSRCYNTNNTTERGIAASILDRLLANSCSSYLEFYTYISAISESIINPENPTKPYFLNLPNDKRKKLARRLARKRRNPNDEDDFDAPVDRLSAYQDSPSFKLSPELLNLSKDIKYKSDTLDEGYLKATFQIFLNRCSLKEYKTALTIIFESIEPYCKQFLNPKIEEAIDYALTPIDGKYPYSGSWVAKAIDAKIGNLVTNDSSKSRGLLYFLESLLTGRSATLFAALICYNISFLETLNKIVKELSNTKSRKLARRKNPTDDRLRMAQHRNDPVAVLREDLRRGRITRKDIKRAVCLKYEPAMLLEASSPKICMWSQFFSRWNELIRPDFAKKFSIDCIQEAKNLLLQHKILKTSDLRDLDSPQYQWHPGLSAAQGNAINYVKDAFKILKNNPKISVWRANLIASYCHRAAAALDYSLITLQTPITFPSIEQYKPGATLEQYNEYLRQKLLKYILKQPDLQADPLPKELVV